MIWIQKYRENPRHVWVRVFAGPDSDHLALTGMLCLIAEEYDELVELIMDGGFRQAKKAQEAGTPLACTPPVLATRAPINAITAMRDKPRWFDWFRKPVSKVVELAYEPRRQRYRTILTIPEEEDK